MHSCTYWQPQMDSVVLNIKEQHINLGEKCGVQDKECGREENY